MSVSAPVTTIPDTAGFRAVDIAVGAPANLNANDWKAVRASGMYPVVFQDNV